MPRVEYIAEVNGVEKNAQTREIPKQEIHLKREYDNLMRLIKRNSDIGDKYRVHLIIEGTVGEQE